jgi:hypothetical protein
MRFSIEDKEYDFEAKMTVAEAMIVQDKANLGLAEFDPALGKGNPYAIAALMYILKRRVGEVVRWEDMLKLNAMSFKMVPDELPDPVDGGAGAAVAEKSPDPTSTSGRTRKRGTTST